MIKSKYAIELEIEDNIYAIYILDGITILVFLLIKLVNYENNKRD